MDVCFLHAFGIDSTQTYVKMRKALRTEGRNALLRGLQALWVEVTGQVKGQYCNSGMGLHQTQNPGRNQVLSATASAQEERIEIHRWKVSEKQEVSDILRGRMSRQEHQKVLFSSNQELYNFI